VFQILEVSQIGVVTAIVDSKKEVNCICRFIVIDQTLYLRVREALGWLRLPTQNSILRYGLIELVVSLLLTECHEEYDVAFLTGYGNNTGKTPSAALRRELGIGRENVMDLSAYIIFESN
jgi:hypothetical protein